jgi:acetate kinase
MILTINCGSSTLKAKLFEIKKENLNEVKNWKIENTNTSSAISKIAKEIDLNKIQIIAHRVVHGGEKYKKATLITKQVKEDIKNFATFAPTHNPANLKAIIISEKVFPKAKHFAIFDTAFHQTMDEKAYLYGLPISFYKKYGIRKYGFHGTNHKYVSNCAKRYLQKKHFKDSKIISCHLGNGVSITAIKDGKSIDTSMGFTPLEGCIMGERSGSFDPAIIFWIIEKGILTKNELKKLLEKKSGLLGISNISFDMRKIWEKYQLGIKEAKLAMEMYCYSIQKYISAYISTLNGVDAIVFTGGIGENAFYLRKIICDNFKFLNLFLDDEKNKKNEFDISTKKSPVKILVIPANEELQMANECM